MERADLYSVTIRDLYFRRVSGLSLREDYQIESSLILGHSSALRLRFIVLRLRCWRFVARQPNYNRVSFASFDLLSYMLHLEFY